MSRRTIPALLLGVLLGVLVLATIRFALAAPPEPVHYHANFAVFIGQERLDLSGDQYMEDVASCAVPGSVRPTERVHLHNNDPDVVHVHHDGATWGHLMTNLGLGLGDGHLVTRDGVVHSESEGRELKFVLNGHPQFSVANELIRSGDRLLVSFGPESEDEVARTQFPQVAANAEEFNALPDPAGCGGAHAPSMWDRLRHAFVG